MLTPLLNSSAPLSLLLHPVSVLLPQRKKARSVALHILETGTIRAFEKILPIQVVLIQLFYHFRSTVQKSCKLIDTTHYPEVLP